MGQGFSKSSSSYESCWGASGDEDDDEEYGSQSGSVDSDPGGAAVLKDSSVRDYSDIGFDHADVVTLTTGVVLFKGHLLLRLIIAWNLLKGF